MGQCPGKKTLFPSVQQQTSTDQRSIALGWTGISTRRSCLSMEETFSGVNADLSVLASPFFGSHDDDQGILSDNVAVIVCNWELPKISRVVLRHARVCVCADGGANRLYDQVPRLFPDKDPDKVRREYLPHLIAGDLDSIRVEVREYYETHGVRVVDLSHDQDSTDLMKCIHAITRGDHTLSIAPQTFTSIVALGAQGGRLDHTLGHLSILHTYRDLPLVLLGGRNVTRLVQKGKTVIRPSSIEGPSCGLVPLTGEAMVTSRGLEWNLENTIMRMGGLVSTCNRIVTGGDDAPEVFVETDSDLVWTVELHYH